MSYIHLALILTAVYLPQYAVWAMPTLAAINVVFAIIFYWLCFGLLTGLKASGVNPEMDVPIAWTSRVIQTAATLVLIMSGNPWFVYIALLSLPWIIINIFTDGFGTLVKWEVLEVTDSSDE